MSLLTLPWLEYELLVQYSDGSSDVNATYSNFAVQASNGADYVISYDAFTAGAVGKSWEFIFSFAGVFVEILIVAD